MVYFSSNLKYLRELRGMTQQDVAEALGNIIRGTVCNWEAGRREPEISMLIRISEYFGVTLDDLVLKSLRPPMPRYAENMVFLRKKRNMSQEDIGHLLRVTQKCVSKYENGESAVDVENLLKLSDFFGVTLDQMVKHDLSKEGV